MRAPRGGAYFPRGPRSMRLLICYAKKDANSKTRKKTISRVGKKFCQRYYVVLKWAVGKLFFKVAKKTNGVGKKFCQRYYVVLKWAVGKKFCTFFK